MHMDYTDMYKICDMLAWKVHLKYMYEYKYVQIYDE